MDGEYPWHKTFNRVSMKGRIFFGLVGSLTFQYLISILERCPIGVGLFCWEAPLFVSGLIAKATWQLLVAALFRDVMQRKATYVKRPMCNKKRRICVQKRYKHLYIQTRTRTNKTTHINTYSYTCIYTEIHAYKYIFIKIYMHMYVHRHTYTNTNSYTYTYT